MYVRRPQAKLTMGNVSTDVRYVRPRIEDLHTNIVLQKCAHAVAFVHTSSQAE